MVPAARPAGRWDAVDLGVHPVTGPGRSVPAYIRRPHDELLRTMLDPKVAHSRLIVIRGDAGTGKSRAADEAVAARLGDWSLAYRRTPPRSRPGWRPGSRSGRCCGSASCASTPMLTAAGPR